MVRREVAGRRLGALEAEIMEFAWSREDWFGVNDLLAVLQGQQRAYTTVMTIVTRLCDKGLLQRRRHGRGFVYRPALSKEALAASSLQAVLDDAEDPQAVLAHFVTGLEASPELFARLRALVGDPTAGEPPVGEPPVGEPTAGEHALHDPTAGERAFSDPVAGGHALGEPAAGTPPLSEPTVSDHAAGEPALHEPAVGEPAGPADGGGR